MRRSFKLSELGCANCAAKMENDINHLPGVNKATISFMTGKLMLDADTDRFDELLAQAQSICTGYEPGCTIIR